MTRRTSLSDRGFLFEEQFLAAGEVEALAEELEVLVRAQLSRRMLSPQPPTGDPVADLAANLAALERGAKGSLQGLVPLSEHAPALARLTADPSLVALARETLAETIGLAGHRRVLVLEPGADEPVGWEAATRAVGPDALLGLIPLQDVGPERGAPHLAPGRHRSAPPTVHPPGDLAFGTLRSDAGRLFAMQPSLMTAVQRKVRWDAAVGDLLLLDARMPVDFEPNHSTHPLFFLTFAFRDLAKTATHCMAPRPEQPSGSAGLPAPWGPVQPLASQAVAGQLP